LAALLRKGGYRAQHQYPRQPASRATSRCRSSSFACVRCQNRGPTARHRTV